MFNKNHFSPLFISILLTILGIGIVIFKMLEGTLTLMSGITLEILLVLILGAQLSHHKMQIRRLQEEQPQRRFQFSPLDGSFMGISMVGLLVSLMYIYQESSTWGIAFTVVFLIMFIASVISMTTADPDAFVDVMTKDEKKKKVKMKKK